MPPWACPYLSPPQCLEGPASIADRTVHALADTVTVVTSKRSVALPDFHSPWPSTCWTALAPRPSSPTRGKGTLMPSTYLDVKMSCDISVRVAVGCGHWSPA